VPLNTAVRRDTWWIKPLLTVIVLGTFAVYATFRAFENAHYHTGPYLSPFYSPLLPFKLNIAGWEVSPALYILIFPLAFRMTCYYYRQAYYRAFFWDPPACAVPEPSARKHYHGEQLFPLVLQNIHRYTLYVALLFLVFLWWDAFHAFWYEGRPYVGLGGIILVITMVLLTGYTLGCHALRHLVGGKLDCFTCPYNANSGQMGETKPQYRFWRFVTGLNNRHMEWAWSSLIVIMLADLYIRLMSMGVIQDLRLL
jgi:hypothetical protein